MKLLLKLCISQVWNPRGLFIATREEGGQVLAQNAAGAAAVRPRKHSPGHVSAAILGPRARRFEPRVVPSVPCQALYPVSSLQPLVFTESAL